MTNRDPPSLANPDPPPRTRRVRRASLWLLLLFCVANAAWGFYGYWYLTFLSQSRIGPTAGAPGNNFESRGVSIGGDDSYLVLNLPNRVSFGTARDFAVSAPQPYDWRDDGAPWFQISKYQQTRFNWPRPVPKEPRWLPGVGIVASGGSFRFAISWWWLTVATMALLYLEERRDRRRRMRSNHCLVCGYDLRASPDRCPECGTPRANRTGAAT